MLYDIHTHILPGVDDGSKTLENSIEMIKEEINNGVTDLILTPHYCPGKLGQLSKHELIKHFNEFKEQIKDYPINLYLGSELLLKNNFLDAIRNNEVLSLNNSKYLLVEFEFGEKKDMIYEKAYNVSCLGYTPIIAHLERYIEADLDLALRLEKLGCLIQVNTTSIEGKFGHKIKKLVHLLLKKGVVDLIASDCHSMNIRKPNLKDVLAIVKKKHKLEFSNELSELNKEFHYQGK